MTTKRTRHTPMKMTDTGRAYLRPNAPKRPTIDEDEARKYLEFILRNVKLSHEFFHSATIDGHPEPGDAAYYDGNVMKTWDDGRDVFVNSTDPNKGIENLTLSPSQLEIVLKDGIPNVYGLPGTRKSPAVKREYQRGSTVDDLGDSTGPGHLDIHTIDMASHTDDEDIHMLLKLGDLFPDTGEVDAVYRLRFDIDNDPLTGEIGVIPGIDRTITIFVERTAGTTGIVVGAELSAADPPGKTLLAPFPQLLTVERIAGRTTIPHLPTAAPFWAGSTGSSRKSSSKPPWEKSMSAEVSHRPPNSASKAPLLMATSSTMGDSGGIMISAVS